MDSVFAFASKYFWVIGIAMSWRYFYFDKSSPTKIEPKDQAIFEDAKRLRHWFGIFSIAPLVIMGIGQISGLTPNVWYFFRPQDGNPIVLAFFAECFASSFIFIYWIFVCDGARRVVEAQPFFVISEPAALTSTPLRVKLLALSTPFWIVLWIGLVSYQNAPIPK